MRAETVVAIVQGMDLTTSFTSALPEDILRRYDVHEVRNAAAVLRSAAPEQFADMLEALGEFQLYTADLITPGGQETHLAARLNASFREMGWREARVDTLIQLSLVLQPYGGEAPNQPITSTVQNEGYKVDNFSGRVALDVEWSAKDGNLDRDLAAYRALYDYGLIDAAVIVTRELYQLRDLGRRLGLESGMAPDRAKKILATTTTTNTTKLLPKLTRGDGGGCPVLVIAISEATWAGPGVEPPTPSELETELAAESEDHLDMEDTVGGLG